MYQFISFSHLSKLQREGWVNSSTLVSGAVKTLVWEWLLQALSASGCGMTGELRWWTSLRVRILSIERIQANPRSHRTKKVEND